MRCPRCRSNLVYQAWYVVHGKNVYQCRACGWGFIR